MKVRNWEVFEIQAEITKMLASPKRLIIVDMLGKREMNVGEIAESLETNPANVSQHLRQLRDKNLVLTRKEGQTVYYRLASARITDACHLFREVLLENLKKRGAIAEDVNPDNLIEDDTPGRGPVSAGGEI